MFVLMSLTTLPSGMVAVIELCQIDVVSVIDACNVAIVMVQSHCNIVKGVMAKWNMGKVSLNSTV